MTWDVIEGDCVEEMRKLSEASVDAVVTDPPYGLEFMNKDWDRLAGDFGQPSERREPIPGHRSGSGETERPTGRTNIYSTENTTALPRYHAGKTSQEWHQAWATEALRVLKPGGHLLAFGGTRTYHRLACAVEDAGFEIRDSVIWLYGSGFPKSLDVSKAIDRAAGAEREVVGRASGMGKQNPEWNGTAQGRAKNSFEPEYDETAPATPEAQRWQGWGTALKPAHEPIVVARKPLIGTVAQNVERFGTGALNIDGCRIEGAPEMPGTTPPTPNGNEQTHGAMTRSPYVQPTGRWPANVALSHLPECEYVHSGTSEEGWEWWCAPGCPVAELDRQSGETGSWSPASRDGGTEHDGELFGVRREGSHYGDFGSGASRFFYVAKASRAERNAGLEGFEERESREWRTGNAPPNVEHRVPDKRSQNSHPTVKPVDLMRWLCRLVTPPDGVVLDPFCGSGTTGIACVLEDFDFIGIERESDYAAIARARIDYWAKQPKQLGLLT